MFLMYSTYINQMFDTEFSLIIFVVIASRCYQEMFIR